MKLSDFATTERQKEVIDTVEACGGNKTKAAKQLGLSRSSVRDCCRIIQKRADSRGFNSRIGMEHELADCERLRGRSWLENIDGKPTWVKTTVDRENLIEFATSLAENACKVIKPVKPRKAIKRNRDKDTMVAYPLGDAHIGLYCWSEDSEENWDCSIAEKVMTDAFEHVLSNSTSTSQALIVNLGDWFHTDTIENMTRKSGHHLDVDTRWPRVFDIGYSLLRKLIDSALLKHDTVRVINAIGNHDDQCSIVLSICLNATYEKEPRVSIDTSPDSFHKYVFGENLIGVHHGHKCPPERLYKVMTEDWAKEWSECKWRYWLTGHVHTHKAIDVGSQQIESFRTLTAKDNYAHSNGYRSPRGFQSITYHREDGEISRCQRLVSSNGR